MARVYLPVPLRKLVAGQESIEASGATVQAVIDELVLRYPTLRSALFDERGRLSRFVGIFVNDEDYRLRGGESSALSASDRLELLLPVAGG